MNSVSFISILSIPPSQNEVMEQDIGVVYPINTSKKFPNIIRNVTSEENMINYIHTITTVTLMWFISKINKLFICWQFPSSCSS